MNRWYFWVLAPVMLGAAIGLPFWTAPPTLGGRILVYGISLALLCATLGLASPRRFAWALKIAAAGIVLVNASYVIHEFLAWRNGAPFGFGGRRSGASLFNALCAFAAFGVPSVLFIAKGRSGRPVDVLLAKSEPQPTAQDDEVQHL